MPRAVTLLISLAALLTLAQCAPAPTVATANTPTAQRTGPAKVVSGGEAGALNALRASYGLPALAPNATLGRMADLHVQDMTRAGFFGHVSSNGDTLVERARAQNYQFCHVGENLAGGIGSFDQVIRHWMNSPRHRANLLHTEAREFGLARGPGNVWVLVLGARGCDGGAGYEWVI